MSPLEVRINKKSCFVLEMIYCKNLNININFFIKLNTFQEKDLGLQTSLLTFLPESVL